MKNKILLPIILSLLFMVTGFAHTIPTLIPQPEELGQVKWLRDYDQAVAKSQSSDKPILILFQEVPGCSTCRGYGNNVLSHPLIVEAIETEFVPLAIHNNKAGKDLAILKSFNEPTWNNPVVRIIDKDRMALTPRIAGQYDAASLVYGMIQSLKAVDHAVPGYLQLLNDHLARKSETATFGMSCFWTGEGKLGSIDGVLRSEPGFMGGSEVVSVQYDPEMISYEKLLVEANKKESFDRVFAHTHEQENIAKKVLKNKPIKTASRFRADDQPKYYLLQTPYRFLPMLPNQASRVNTAIGQQQDPSAFLSKRQIFTLGYIQNHPNLNWTNEYNTKYFTASWANLREKMKEQP